MFRIGRMMRSAKMKLITPPKLIPPFHSTTARGTFPTEQTKLSMEITGPISGLQNSFSAGWLVRKNACHQLFGTQAASAPAIRKPSPMSTYRAFRSIKKVWEIAVNARGEKTRERNRPSVMDMSITDRSEEHTSELQSQFHLVCRLLLEKKKLAMNVKSESSCLIRSAQVRKLDIVY